MKKKLEIQHVTLIVTILQIAYTLMAFSEASGADGASLVIKRVMHSGGLGLAAVMVAAFIMADRLFNVQKMIKMAVMSVDNKELSEYTFYLGREYGVTGVWDADGKAMPYAVDRNTLSS